MPSARRWLALVAALTLWTETVLAAPDEHREPLVAWPDDGDAQERPGDDADSKAQPQKRAEPAKGALSKKAAPHPDHDTPLPEGADERPGYDYDARPDETSPGGVLLWVPRVLVSPLYLVSEYVVRRPIGWLATTAEKKHWPTLILDALRFGPEEKMAVVPSALIDFGFRPSIGLYYFWDDALAEGNHFRLFAAWGGPNWYSAAVKDRLELGEESDVSLRLDFLQRPDWVYHGAGPRAASSDRGRFQQRTLDGSLEYYSLLPRSSLVEALAGVRYSELDGSIGCCSDATVADRVASGVYASPPAMDDDYTLAYQQARLVLDSRPRRFPKELEEGSDYVSPPASGVHLAVKGTHAIGLAPRTDAVGREARDHFVRYGGEAGGFVDAFGDQRVFGLTVMAEFADPIGDAPEIPITEQVQLGGDSALQGGLQGRLVDRSAAAAKLSYQWPVWVWLDGQAFYEMGNVFGTHLESFDLGLLRSSFGLGIRGNSSRDHVFQLLVAFMTEPIADGHAVDEVRFVFGASNEF